MNVTERIIQIPILMEVNTRIQELRERITRYNYQYYTLNCSPVSDAEFDALYLQLVELERKHPQLVDPDSPTQRIGAESTSDFKKAKHSDQRMLSLDNTKTAAEVIDYIGLVETVMEPKIDGASLKIFYRKGRLVQAVTRGNGMEGDDVTANVRAVMSVPLILQAKVTITVVGEVYMTFSTFNDLNRKLEIEGAPLMANPRNAASGAIKLKSPKEVASRNLSFVAYGSTTEFSNITAQSQLTDYLEVLGFQSVYMLPTTESCQTVADCFQIKDAESLAARIVEADVHRRFLDLPTDGLVFKVNDLAMQRELGEGTKAPYYACAFKYPPEQKETTLISITVQIGRTGRVTPVAELEPVLLSGTMVSRASLCNQDEINRLKLNVGDTVMVEKSAEIIPKVMRVAAKRRAGVYVLPSNCPCCGTKLVCPEGFVDSYCPNRDCEDQVTGRLLHGCGKSALDIDGCGDTLVREMVRHGVRRMSDVFTLDPSFMKPAARKRFEAGRAACAGQPLWRKYHALGIEGFGQTLCQEVASRWSSLSSAFDEMEALRSLVGESVFLSIVNYCGENEKELDALDAYIGLTSSQQAEGPLKGKAFCITGDLVSGSRNAVSRVIEEAGGVVKASVTRHLSYLIQGTETGRKKKADAEKKGIPVITEQQLYEMMGREMPVQKHVDEREY